MSATEWEAAGRGRWAWAEFDVKVVVLRYEALGEAVSSEEGRT